MIRYTNFSMDLVEKTIELFPLSGEDKVSHLLNLYLGLVVIPYRMLTKHNLWDNMTADLGHYHLNLDEMSNNCTLQSIAETIVNALLEGNVKYKDENREHISKACFSDIELTNNQLKNFAQAFATEYLRVAKDAQLDK